FRLILPQNVTEELLLGHARRVGADVRHGVRVGDLHQDGDAVHVQIDTPDGPATLSAPWVVGADGGRSTVREAVGIPFEGHDGTFTGIAADVTLRFPWPEGRRMIDNERGWVTSFPFGETDPVTRFNLVHAERRRAPQSEPVTVEEVRRCVADILGADLPMDELRWGSRFTDAMRKAPRWREGRVLLLGEACRIHYPASGVGMNFCIQDAFNLGWKLAAVVNGHADDALLDSYETERTPVTDALLESVKSQVAVQFNFSPEGVAFKRMFQAQLMPMAEVNSRLAHELNGLTAPYPVPPGSHKLTGERVPDVELMRPGGLRRVGEMLRNGRFLLADLTGNDAYNTEPALGGLPVERVSGVPVLIPDSMCGVTSLLVRPDAYVAWAGTGAPSPAQAADEVARWLRRAA
ncbi:MAG: FAD-dependent monooxygenase, partial [Acetobacteraceae bacterium]|nr:FAD-dependent monooxygenase [Acetobacteraceae bacterium]